MEKSTGRRSSKKWYRVHGLLRVIKKKARGNLEKCASSSSCTLFHSFLHEKCRVRVRVGYWSATCTPMRANQLTIYKYFAHCCLYRKSEIICKFIRQRKERVDTKLELQWFECFSKRFSIDRGMHLFFSLLVSCNLQCFTPNKSNGFQLVNPLGLNLLCFPSTPR